MPLIPNLSLYLIQKFDRLALWGNLTILELHFAETQVCFIFSLTLTFSQLMDLQLSGIPTIYDMILDDDSLILIEEYIHGQTLEQLLNDQNTLIYSDAYQ